MWACCFPLNFGKKFFILHIEERTLWRGKTKVFRHQFVFDSFLWNLNVWAHGEFDPMFLTSMNHVFFWVHQNCWWWNTAPLGVLCRCDEMTVWSWPFLRWVKHTQGPTCLSHPSQKMSSKAPSPSGHSAAKPGPTFMCHVTELLTGIVWLPCKALIAAWASACEEYFTNAHPRRGKRTLEELQGYQRQSV